MTAEIWADCIERPCPNCQQPPGSYCVLHVNGKTYPKHAPCISRLKEAS